MKLRQSIVSFALLTLSLAFSLLWGGAAIASPLSLGTWNQIARIADDGGGMFDGDGDLLSTYTYGTKTANATTQNDDFQIAFDVYDGMEILFITGNEEVWGKTDYATLRALIDAQAGVISSTNIQFESRVNGVEQTTQGNVLSRSTQVEDPWINLLGNHIDGINNQTIIWGENNFVGVHTALKEANGGINVFVSVESTIPVPAPVLLMGAVLLLVRRMRRIAGMGAGLVSLLALIPMFMSTAQAATLSSVAASSLTGSLECKSGATPTGCYHQGYDTSNNLAHQGNAGVQAAVSKDTLAGYPTIHNETFANDGYYGNGASWISASANSWLKIDLGATASIDGISFGRDRLGYYADRSPGQFTIEVALTDDVYANGNDLNDGLEYTQIIDSSVLGFSGTLASAQTILASFDAVDARFIKMTFSNAGTAIDEIEVFGSFASSSIPTLGTLGLMSLGLLAVRTRRPGSRVKG